jgi:DNA-binding MarR family transcriptional regulator
MNKTATVGMDESTRLPDGEAAAHDLFRKLLQSFIDLLAIDELILSSLGTRHRRLVLLMVLHKHAHRKMTAAELAQATGVPGAAVSILLDSLERDGLVTLQVDPLGRGLNRFELTPTGDQLLQRISLTYFEWFTRSITPVTEDERVQLVRIVRKLRHRLAESECRPAAKGSP